MLTYEQARRLFFQSEDGVLRWAQSTSRSVLMGDAAGSVCHGGYIKVFYRGKRYFAHRLCWLLTRGEWPDGEIDHIDGNPANNKMNNLRSVSHAVNMQNRRRPKASKGGLLGVTSLPSGRFQAQISCDGRTRYIGKYSSAEQAHAAYVSAKRRLHAGCTI